MAEQHLIYHWKHGWIPLTHAAALSKAHGSSHLADKYVSGTSQHASMATHGKSARQIHGELGPHSDVAHPVGSTVIARQPGVPSSRGVVVGHGAGGVKVAHKDQHQNTVVGTFRPEHLTPAEPRVPATPTTAAEVERLQPGDKARVSGMDEFGQSMTFTGVVHGRPTGVRIKRGENGTVEPHFAVPMHNGSDLSGVDATARTTVYVPNPGGTTTTPPIAAAGPATAAEAFRMAGPDLRRHAASGSTVAQAEIDRRTARRAAGGAKRTSKPATKAETHPVGSEVAVKVDGPTWRLGTVTAHTADGRVTVHAPGHGTVTRSREDVLPTNEIPAATRAAEARRHAQQAETDRRIAENQRQRDAAAAASTPSEDHATAEQRWEAENKRIAPSGHTISSRVLSTTNGAPRGLHTQHAPNGERVGSVIERSDGTFRATFDGKELSNHSNRADAHAALAAKYNADTVARQAKVDAAARKAARATKVGVFEPTPIQGDGTRIGDAAAAKIKQSFKYNNHTVHIETAMSKDQTKAFLDDLHSVLLKANLHDAGQGITFHVPSGDSKFRANRRGVVGGYVREGQRTVHINPKVANGALSEQFGGANAGASFMTAAAQTSGRQYVITHEIGHILDHAAEHTHDTTLLGSRQVKFRSPREDVATMARSHKDSLSRYGKTNVSESYAEAYAQWVHGGPGSNQAADAYAARFGWKPPKWYREARG